MLYVPVVTLNTENNDKLHDLLGKSFQGSGIWNEYKSKIQTVTTIAANGGNNDTIRVLLDSSFQGVKYSKKYSTVKRNTDEENSRRRYFLPRTEIKL